FGRIGRLVLRIATYGSQQADQDCHCRHCVILSTLQASLLHRKHIDGIEDLDKELQYLKKALRLESKLLILWSMCSMDK
ncbi:uncharacterized protein A4U43_C04F18910, partial [Asparagus officinalis]